MTIWVDVTKKYRDPKYYEGDSTGNYITVAQQGGGGSSIEYAPLNHTHVIGNITGLQTALDGKSATTHNHDASYSAIGHNHDASYSAIGHNHDASYSVIGHNHDANYVKIGVTNTNYLDFSIAPDAYGYSCAVNAYAYGSDSYGLVGMAEKHPIVACSLVTTGNVSKTTVAMRRDSAHTTPQIGCGVDLAAFLPVLGWSDPKNSERLAGYITFKWVDITQGAEAADMEIWLLSHGTMTKVKTLTHDGTWV